MPTKLHRKPCLGPACPDPAHAARASGPFFQPGGPTVQRQGEGTPAEAEKKDPLTEGLKVTGKHLLAHEPFKKWYEPHARRLKLRLWDHLAPGEKAALLTWLGVDLGIAGAAFASSPRLRQLLSGTDIGAPLSLIPYSPVTGFKYTLPKAGTGAGGSSGDTGLGLSADFFLNPYLGLLRQHLPGLPLTGARFGLDTQVGGASPFSVTGGRFALNFFGGGLKAEGKTFSDLPPHLPALPGGPDAAQAFTGPLPGEPALRQPGMQFMLQADLLKLLPWLRGSR